MCRVSRLLLTAKKTGESAMRVVGLDVHRSFAQVAFFENGTAKSGGRLPLEREKIVEFACAKLRTTDEVVLEATTNTTTIVKLLKQHVRRVVVANQIQVRAIAWAKVKTDKIDAAMLAKLHAAGFLPEVWCPDDETELLRRLVADRMQLVQHMTRLRNRIHAVLHAHLIPVYKGKLLSKAGRQWLAAQPLEPDQRRVVQRHLEEHDRIATELSVIERDLASRGLQDPRLKRMMTVGGVNIMVAVSLLAAIGDIARFSSPAKLVSYLGLNPRVRQSGDRPAYHGRITKHGRGQARAMLVEAAWSISKQPGPLRAFFNRIKSKRGGPIAATATARKLAVLIWHLLTKQEDYTWKRPALYEWKIRKLELAAGYPSERGGTKKGRASEYHLRSSRDRERKWIGMAEEEYRQFVNDWRTQPTRQSGSIKT